MSEVVIGIVWEGSQRKVLTATRAQMVCTPRQARLAMMRTPYSEYPSLLSAVEGLIYASDDAALKVSWEYATEWRRDDPAIEALGGALGLTETQIDALFTLAMSL